MERLEEQSLGRRGPRKMEKSIQEYLFRQNTNRYLLLLGPEGLFLFALLTKEIHFFRQGAFSIR